MDKQILEKIKTSPINTLEPKTLSEFTIEDWKEYLGLNDGIIFTTDEVILMITALNHYRDVMDKILSECSERMAAFKEIDDLKLKILNKENDDD